MWAEWVSASSMALDVSTWAADDQKHIDRGCVTILAHSRFPFKELDGDDRCTNQEE